MDYNNDEKIEFSEFAAAAMLNRLRDKEDLILSSFRYFDVDDSGFISAEDLMESFHNVGFKIPYREVKDLIEEAGIGDNITYRAFREAVLE